MPTIHSVAVDGRDDGLYLFTSSSLAEAFAQAVRYAGGEATIGEEPVNGGNATYELVVTELADEVPEHRWAWTAGQIMSGKEV